MLSLPNYLHFIFMKEIFAFCNIAVIPIRAEASHRSEMVSQLLFGEAYNIVDYQEEWVKIKSLFDNYEGYIDRRQIALIHESSYKKYYQDNFKPAVAFEPTEVYDKVRKCSFLVPNLHLSYYHRMIHLQQLREWVSLFCRVLRSGPLLCY